MHIKPTISKAEMLQDAIDFLQSNYNNQACYLDECEKKEDLQKLINSIYPLEYLIKQTEKALASEIKKNPIELKIPFNSHLNSKL